MRTALFAVLLASHLAAQASHASFESPQTHPLHLSADGLRLAVLNTPAARLSLYSLADPRLPVLLRDVPVAAEPVAVRMRGSDEAWVVCHLADAVQVVDLDAGEVVDTVHLGDEPADVVFAGGKAFVTLATAAEVAVVDPATRRVVARVALPCDQPRWMVASRDGGRLWVASHRSGNRTTLLPQSHAPAQPDPTNPALPAPPRVSRIVDAADARWQHAHGVDLADWDVFELDAADGSVRRRVPGVGTTLFGMAERPQDGSLWVANTDARNLVRFEPELRGHVVDHRVTRIDPGAPTSGVESFDLHVGLDYGTLPHPAAREIALAQPADVVWSPAGDRLYVAAFGTDRIGVLDPTGSVVGRIPLTATAAGDAADPRNKRGPRALALHPSQGVLYVLNRLRNSLSIVDVAQRSVLDEVELPDPTPAAVKQGRGFLYDAMLSGNGTASCSSCHIDGDVDGLAWDLGDPGGSLRTVPTLLGTYVSVHPMKGPMVTQSLKGIDISGALHWRGEMRGFNAFNATFDSLLGGAVLDRADLASFRGFIDSTERAPNPNQQLDRGFADAPAGMPSARRGKQLFETSFARLYTGTMSCTACHGNGDGTSNQLIHAGRLFLPQSFRAANLSEVYRRLGRRADPLGRRTSGFGLSFDGRFDDARGHLSTFAFGMLQPAERADLQAYVESFDTGTAPTVGHVVTVDAANVGDPDVDRRRSTLAARAAAHDCDVVVRGAVDGIERGFLFDARAGVFLSDRDGEAAVDGATLSQWIRRVTHSATPRPGSCVPRVSPGTG